MKRLILAAVLLAGPDAFVTGTVEPYIVLDGVRQLAAAEFLTVEVLEPDACPYTPEPLRPHLDCVDDTNYMSDRFRFSLGPLSPGTWTVAVRCTFPPYHQLATHEVLVGPGERVKMRIVFDITTPRCFE